MFKCPAAVLESTALNKMNHTEHQGIWATARVVFHIFTTVLTAKQNTNTKKKSESITPFFNSVIMSNKNHENVHEILTGLSSVSSNTFVCQATIRCEKRKYITLLFLSHTCILHFEWIQPCTETLTNMISEFICSERVWAPLNTISSWGVWNHI